MSLIIGDISLQLHVNGAVVLVEYSIFTDIRISLIYYEFKDNKWAEIVQSEDRQDHGQQKEKKGKHKTHNTTLRTRVSSGAPLVDKSQSRYIATSMLVTTV